MRIGFGNEGLPVDTPEPLQGAVNLGFGHFPLYRLFLIGATALVLLARCGCSSRRPVTA